MQDAAIVGLSSVLRGLGSHRHHSDPYCPLSVRMSPLVAVQMLRRKGYIERGKAGENRVLLYNLTLYALYHTRFRQKLSLIQTYHNTKLLYSSLPPEIHNHGAQTSTLLPLLQKYVSPAVVLLCLFFFFRSTNTPVKTSPSQSPATIAVYPIPRSRSLISDGNALALTTSHYAFTWYRWSTSSCRRKPLKPHASRQTSTW